MDKKTFAYGFLIAFGVLTWYLYSNNDLIATAIAHDGINGMFWYFISNMSYVLLIFAIVILNRDSGVSTIRSLLGAILIIYAFDIVSYPRFSPVAMTTDLTMLASSDALAINKIKALGFSYPTTYTFYYLVLPLLLLVLSIQLLGIDNFYRKITGR